MTKHLVLAGIMVLATAASGVAPHPAVAQGASPQAPGAPAAPSQEAAPAQSQGVAGISYSPPLRGAPGGRVGGASRGAVKPPAPLPTIDLLAPADQAGQTVSAAPTLYYFVSRPVASPMQLTISAPLRPAPILEVNIKAPHAPGIHPLRLADYRARLEPGIVYTWSVSIILDPKAWSRNIVASAAILRVAPDPETAGAAASPGLRQAATFARAGLWYDAISAAFDNRGSDGHAALDHLMEQVGLTEAARFDRTTRSVGQ
ncbi:MAG TPA: DUF928 domain-containing protein [Stellaceae bacterium]|nr:DUF928 domain-containing protein [Stellaceae bacterium]